MQMKKAITFEEAVDSFKKNIEEGDVKVTDEMIGQLMDIFTPIPSLKLNKTQKANPQDRQIKKNKRPRIKNKLYKFNIFQ